jgi:hypothetical protein
MWDVLHESSGVGWDVRGGGRVLKYFAPPGLSDSNYPGCVRILVPYPMAQKAYFVFTVIDFVASVVEVWNARPAGVLMVMR